MKLDEAIKHCEEVVERNDMCKECKQEHLQLSKWLKELKYLKSILVRCDECECRDECSQQVHFKVGGYIDIDFCSLGERGNPNES